MSSVKTLLDTLASLDIEIDISDGKLECFGPPDALTSELQSEITRLEPQIIHYLERGEIESEEDTVSQITERSGGQTPVSWCQQRIWYINTLQPDTQNYHIPFGFEFNGDLQISALQAALRLIIQRHQVLRSKVFMQGEDLIQELITDFETPFEFADCTHLNGQQQVIRDEAISPFLRKPFNLNGDVFLRLKVIRISAHSHYLIFNAHHIAFDGWSMEVLLREINSLYQAEVSGQSSPLRPLKMQYQDFASQQRLESQSALFTQQLDYWRDTLKQLPQLHNIVTDNPRKPVQQFSGASEILVLDERQTQQLESLCQSNGVTLFMLLETALAVLFSAVSKENDVVIGTPVAGRLTKETESLIGYFSNTLVLRTEIKQSESFIDLLQRNKLSILDAFEFQSVPFDLLVEELQPNRSLSHAPLVQLLFTFQEENQQGNVQTGVLKGLSDNQVSTNKTVKFDLESYVTRADGQLRIRFDYDVDLYLKSTVKYLLQGYVRLLNGIVANPQSGIAQLVNIEQINEIATVSAPVRVNGYPVDASYIESILNSIQFVTKGQIGLELNDTGEQELIARVELQQDQTLQDVKDILKAQLPDYLLPQRFQFLNQVEGSDSIQEVDKIAVNAEIEAELINIWAELLKQEASDINPSDDFFALGGHSLLVVRLVAKIRTELACELSLDTIYDVPVLRELANTIAKQTSAELDEGIKQVDRGEQEFWPLSFSQNRLWFIDKFQGESPEYNMPIALNVHGDFNVVTANAAIEAIIKRHEVLRTNFKELNGTPVQCLHSVVDFAITVLDLTHLNGIEAQAAVSELVAEDADKPFNLADDVLLRACYIKLTAVADEPQGVLLFNLHHIISDGWSSHLLLKEFQQFYFGLQHDKDIDLPELPIQYIDYCMWQQEHLKDGQLESQLDYWQKSLADAPLLHSLPLDFDRPHSKSSKGSTISHKICETLTQALYSKAQGQGVTPFVFIHSALSLLLSKYSSSTDIVLGTPVANRTHSEVESLIGFFANTIVLRTQITQTSFVDYLHYVKSVNQGAQANQDVPFELLVERLKIPRSEQNTPLFQIMINMNTVEGNERQSLPEMKMTPINTSQEVALFDLNITIEPINGELLVRWQYDTSLFAAQSVENLASHFEELLNIVCDNIDVPLSDIQLDPISSEVLLPNGLQRQSCQAKALKTKNVLALLSNAMQQHTKAEAVVEGKHSLTYEQLDCLSNQMANYLIERGVSVGDRIGICLAKTRWLPVTTLAVLKAGATYVPMDVNYPASRIQHIANDSELFLMLCESANSFEDKIASDVLLPLPKVLEDMQRCQENKPEAYNAVSVDDLCYIIYTSGSTGKPKGVRLSHRVLYNLIDTIAEQCKELSDPLATLQYASPGFDMCFADIFMTLSSGGTLHMINESLQLDLVNLIDYLRDNKVARINLPYAVLKQISTLCRNANYKLPALRVVLSTAEQLKITQDIRWFFNKHEQCRLVNHYGPSETHVVTGYLLPDSPDSWPVLPPIGKPINNVDAYVLDPYGCEVPVGGQGILQIGQFAATDGYQNLAELSAEKLRVLPAISTELLFDTGDLVRVHADGNLSYLGRNDLQIKIRGFRIEPAEIEEALNGVTCLENSCVTSMGDDDLKYLVAYAVFKPGQELLESQIKQQLSEVLPAYMVPDRILVVDNIPLNDNGKVNFASLPKAQINQTDVVSMVSTDTEKSVQDIWQKLLQVSHDIDASASFFEIGGHSLLAVRLIAEVNNQLGIELQIADIFANTNIRQQAQLIDQGSKTDVILPVTARSEALTDLPLSYAQQRMWFIDRLGGGSPQYNMPMAFYTEKHVDLNAVEEAFNTIIARHEVLRSVFFHGSQGPRQRVLPKVNFSIEKHDLRTLEDSDKVKKARQIMTQDSQKSFDLSKDCLLRASFIQLDDSGNTEVGILLVNIHHIATDGWSTRILLDEFCAIYQSAVENKAIDLKPLELQYGDYACWQQDFFALKQTEKSLDYWQQQLVDLPTVHDIPLDKPRPENKSHNADVEVLRIPQEKKLALEKFARDKGLTPFMLYHAALALVIATNSNSSDIVIGTPVANRMQTELDQMIGFFVNTLVLRLDTKQEDLGAYFNHVKEINLLAQTHQAIPFEQIVDVCNVERNVQHTPLFQIMFDMDTSQSSEVSLSGLGFSMIKGHGLSAPFDMNISVNVMQDELELKWVYDTSIFNKAHIRKLLSHFNNVLQFFAATVIKGDDLTALRVQDVPLLSQSEISELSLQLNGLTVHQNDELYEFTPLWIHICKQAELQPNSAALISANETVSYGQLIERVHKVGACLQQQGIGRGHRVAVGVTRELDAVVAVLAVHACGAVFVPIALEPVNRAGFILKDTNARCLLLTDSQAELAAELETEIPQLLISQCNSPHDFELPDWKAEDEAYIIYTSGSTGQPKGVVATQNNLACFVTAFIEAHDFKEQRLLMLPPLTFDAALGDLFPALVKGATLVFHPDPGLLDAIELQNFCERHQVSAIDAPAALWARWAEDLAVHFAPHEILPNLKMMMVGGEAVSRSQVQHFANITQHRVAFYNHYGPTEASVCATIYETISGEEHGGKDLPIGQPVEGAKVYVLDEHQNLLPKGTKGELYIGGVGVTKGYLNRPDLTEYHFVRDPFAKNINAKMYRTGDIVSWNDNNQLLFHGRKDEQVKIRGFRIELKDIESHINRHDSVKSSLVMVNTDMLGEKQLLAYLIPESSEHSIDKSVLIATLKDELALQLPSYMIPTAFMQIEQWPLTRHGKIDKKALPAPEEVQQHTEYVAAQTETEHTLVAIWSKLLQMSKDSISITANFFEAGGHSLLAIRLMTEIRSALHKELPVKDIFDYPDIRSLAVRLDQSEALVTRKAITPVPRDNGPLPLSFAQQRLWFIDQLEGSSHEYNMPAALRVKGEFDVNAAEIALQRIIARHEPLRTIFTNTPEGPVQLIREQVEFTLTTSDLSHLEELQQAAEVKKQVERDRTTAFNLQQDIMLRACYLRLTAEDGVLLFNMHHIASDGWSMGILVEEFASQYQAIINNDSEPLQPLSIQYADFAHWQREWLSGEELHSQLSYWRTQLQDVPAVHSIPLDFPRPAMKAHSGKQIDTVISAELADDLRQLAQAQGVTLFMLIHSALALVLSRHSHSEDIVIGTPVANRMESELEPLIGFFVNTLVLRTNTEERGFIDYLHHVKQVNMDAQTYQDIPFENLVEHCKVLRSIQHTPLMQIMFSMDTQGSAEIGIPGLQFSALEEDKQNVVAKFDLDVTAQEMADGIALSWVYDTSIFSDERVARMGQHLCTLLSSIAATPKVMLSELEMLSDKERAHQLSTLNQTEQHLPKGELIHELFEAQAAHSPDGLALKFENSTMSYQQLNEQANRLAHYLREEGVTADSLVALYVERSMEMVVSILAVLKAGGAYVPIEPNTPQSRLEHILKDTAVRTLLTQSTLTSQFSVPENVNITEVDNWLAEDREMVCINPERLAQQDARNLAYVIYTSGSTGQPKGVMVEHHSVVNLINSQSRSYQLSSDECVAMFSSYVFDASVEQLFMGLLNGAVVFVPTRTEVNDPRLFISRMEQVGVTHLDVTPSYLSLLGDCNGYQGLKRVICGGESCSEALTQTWGELLNNVYGPTECTVTVLQNTKHNEQREYNSIGKPIANTQAFILSDTQKLVPMGAAGELCIGGASLARGYLNRPELTQERFIQHPFSEDPSERLYRTGDLVRYLPDGNVMFMGRIDEQVKIRGYRVELGEIEYQMKESGLLESCLVQAQEKDGLTTLVAYMVPESMGEATEVQLIDDVRHSLQQALPEYMQPSFYVVMQNWPLTANGKIDKKALPEPEGSLQKRAYLPPNTNTEKSLCTLWEQVLGLPERTVSADGDFFDLGGHSLSAVKLITQINETFELSLPLATLFSAKSPHLLAKVIEKVQGNSKEQESQILIPIQTTDNTEAVFAVPGVGGSVLSFQPLGEAMLGKKSLFGLQPVGFDGHTSVFTTVEQTALANIEAIKSLKPKGPYHLLGHSYGGVVAYEMARLLLEDNQQVASLTLLDSLAPQRFQDITVVDDAKLLKDICIEFGHMYSLDLNSKLELPQYTDDESLELEITSLLNSFDEDISASDFMAFYRVYKANLYCYQSYKPLPLNTKLKVNLFVANNSLTIEEREGVMNPETDYGWNSLLKEPVKTTVLDADHHSILSSKWVRRIVAPFHL